MSGVENNTLKKLVKGAIRQNLSGNAFIELFNELNDRLLINEHEIQEVLLELSDEVSRRAENQHKVNYSLTLMTWSTPLLNTFWKLFDGLTIYSQLQYVIQLSNMFMERSKADRIPIELKQELLRLHIPQYTERFILSISNFDTLDHDHLSLFNHILMLWTAIIKKYKSLIDETVFKDLSTKITASLQKFDLKNMLTYFNASLVLFSQSNFTSLQSDAIDGDFKISFLKGTSASQIARGVTSFNANSKKFLHLNQEKAFLWANTVMRSWQFDVDYFLTVFESHFFVRSHSGTQKQYNFCVDLISLIFKGLVNAVHSHEPNYVLMNWRIFLVSKLPIMLKKTISKFINTGLDLEGIAKQSRLEEAILSSFNSLGEKPMKTIAAFSINTSKAIDLRQEFLKSCIYHCVLPVSSFHRFFPMESLITPEHLQDAVDHFDDVKSVSDEIITKITETNSDISSLEEQGFFSLLESIAEKLTHSSSKMQQFAEQVNGTITKLIEGKDTEKLSRLLLAITYNYELLHLICFNTTKGPVQIVESLINYIDSHDMNVDEDDNFQDTYSYFGNILLGTILIIETFQADVSKFQTSSFTINYMNNFYLRLCDNYSEKCDTSSTEEEEIVNNYKELLGDWVKTLFDENNDGLSDDLIKSVGIKKIHKIVPIVYLQSVTATISGKIDFQVLNNGLDYLTQVFLVPSCLSFISWLLRKAIIIGPDRENVPLKTIHSLLKQNLEQVEEQNNEAKLIFLMVLKTKGSDIIGSLTRDKRWENNSTVQEIVHITQKSIGNFLQPAVDINLNDDINLYEEFGNAIINLVVKEEKNYRLAFDLFRIIGVEKLIKYIIDLIITYQYSITGSEDVKIFINVAIFLISLSSIGLDKEKWLEHISSQTVEFKTLLPSDSAFTAPFSLHYSSVLEETNQPRSFADDLFNDEMNKADSTVLSVDLVLSNIKNVLSPLLMFRDIEESSNKSSVLKATDVFREIFMYNINAI